MGVRLEVILAWIILCAPSGLIFHQSPDSRAISNGSIAGRVAVGGKPKRAASVILTKQEGGQPIGRTVTDDEGRYRLTDVIAGAYLVNAFAPGFVASRWGRAVAVADGETTEGVDLALGRGSVITGRIVHASGQPIIAATVKLTPLDERGRATSFTVSNPAMHRTDDRGVYRLYGLPSGRYLVSVGESAIAGPMTFPTGFFKLTFYSGVTDESEASVIQLDEGREVTNIDIKVSSFLRSYSVSGRAFEARTGLPVPGIRFGYVALTDDGKPDPRGSRALTDVLSTETGEFRIQGLLPGRYAAWPVFLPNEGTSNLYSDPIVFELKDSDIRGIEFKVRRGASISGQAVFEGGPDASIMAKLKELFVVADVMPRAMESLRTDFIPPRIGSDGTFHISGLRDGTATIVVAARGDRNVSLLRIEHNGVLVPAIELREGETVTGVLLILVYGTGSVRGQVSVENGILPGGLVVTGQRNDLKKTWTADVDGRGYFVLEGLPAGEYELMLLQKDRSGTPAMELLKQTVTVSNAFQSQVTFTLNTGRRN